MKKPILLLSSALTLLLFACLAAPDEPTASSESALGCAANERRFNGTCRKTCGTNADCGGNDACMKVSYDTALCLDYKHCAHLGSDTSCRAGHASPYGYSELTTGYYGEPACVGDAQWETAPASGDPACGVSHPVTRCAPTPTGCGLVGGSTIDLADP